VTLPGRARQGGRALPEGQEGLFWHPPVKARSAGFERQRAAFSLDTFFSTAWMQEVGRKPLLRFLHSPHPCGLATQGAVAEAAQKKVSRLRVREPDLNQRRGSDS
jgi:hypothetical protein